MTYKSVASHIGFVLVCAMLLGMSGAFAQQVSVNYEHHEAPVYQNPPVYQNQYPVQGNGQGNAMGQPYGHLIPQPQYMERPTAYVPYYNHAYGQPRAYYPAPVRVISPDRMVPVYYPYPVYPARHRHGRHNDTNVNVQFDNQGNFSIGANVDLGSRRR